MISAEMLQPITEALTSNVNVILPVGLGIMGTMIGIGLIPRLVYKFLQDFVEQILTVLSIYNNLIILLF